MNHKTLLSLGALAVVACGAALLILARDGGGTEARADAQPVLFPELRARVNDVARITIEGGGQDLALELEDGAWGLSDKGGYPVEIDKVKALVVGLAELTQLEEKTSDPALFSKLEVQDPAPGDVPARRVRLFDASGAVLADLIVGRSSLGGGMGQSTIYVRRPDGGPALEVRGRLAVDSSPANWLNRQIAKLERTRVREVVVTHPEGEVLTVRRDAPEESEFQVAELPEGAELSWAGVAGSVAGALEYLNLEDVRPAEGTAFDPAASVSARFTTFDGLVLTARTLEEGDKVLLAISAAYDEAARVREPEGPPEPVAAEVAETGADPAEAVAEDEQKKAPGKTPEEVQKEAEELNARVGRWIFVVPGYAGSNLRKHLADLLKKDEEPMPDLADPFGEDAGEPPAQEPAPEEPDQPDPPVVDKPGGGGD